MFYRDRDKEIGGTPNGAYCEEKKERSAGHQVSVVEKQGPFVPSAKCPTP